MREKPRFIISRKEVLRRYDDVRKICDIVSYSEKTNQDIAKILGETECSFSVHSLESLERLGLPSRSWYFAQAWDEEEIGIIFSKGCARFVVDNEPDLTTLTSFLQKTGRKCELLLRMRLKEHTINTGKHFVYGFYSTKVNELLPELKKNKSIERLGIHFHRKTQNVSEWNLMSELKDSITEENLKRLDYVNIGGGIPSEYKNSIPPTDAIFHKIIALKEYLNSMGIKVIAEPGRYIASYPVRLVANIVSVYDNNIIIDCSVYNSAMDTFVANVRLFVAGELSPGEGKLYTIKGCTPDSMDIFRYNVWLSEPKVGDKIIFLNAGAYTYSTDFCRLTRPDVVVVE